ncbi:MAG TPA: hypothetical protein VFP58_01150 [Candidatus Eisenbacteria bacterium]|nr:hypothetical protein [Candidatus Eisenbacteria bacterium]
MKRRSLARALTLSGSLLLLLLACAWIGHSLWSPSPPVPVEEPVHSDDESEVLQAAAAPPASESPERRSGSIAEPARVDRSAAAAPRSSADTRSEAPAAAGMVVGLDPETGMWGAPTHEQLRELAEIRSRTEGDAHRVAKPGGWLPEVRHPDGHVSVDLNGQFQEFTTVRVGPDGKPVFTCVHGPEDAERVAKEPAPPALEER